MTEFPRIEEEVEDLKNILRRRNLTEKGLQLLKEYEYVLSKVKNLALSDVSKSFKVIDVDLFDYTQITIINETESYVVCHMYTMDNMDLQRVRQQAQAMCDALNVC